MFKFVSDRQIYDCVITELIPQAKRYLWIATADIKDMYVATGRQMVPFLEVLSSLIDKQVEVRLLHAKEPGPAFRKDYDRYPNLITGMERILCPRVHFKCVIIDGKTAWFGSANLTGAGMGAKSEHKRNFEMGFVTAQPELIEPISEHFDSVWRGEHCRTCGRKKYCADFHDLQPVISRSKTRNPKPLKNKCHK